MLVSLCFSLREFHIAQFLDFPTIRVKRGPPVRIRTIYVNTHQQNKMKTFSLVLKLLTVCLKDVNRKCVLRRISFFAFLPRGNDLLLKLTYI